MPQMVSEKYWQESVAAAQREQNVHQRDANRSALAQFVFACGLILIVTMWESWLPHLAIGTDHVVEYLIAFYHG